MRVTGNYTAIDAHFNRLSNAPSRKGVRALEAALNTGVGFVKLATHVDTGSLKDSVTGESERTAMNKWEGTITAGGPSSGPNNPVDYAIYEKRRGGAHDFFEPLKAMDPIFVQAMKKGMD